MATTTGSNAELVRRTFDALNRADLSALREFWSDETVERFPDRTCRGAEEIATYFRETLAAISDFHMDLLAITEQGEDVFVQWHLTGTHTGPIQGIEPTGKPIAVDGMDHFVIRDGKVISNFVVFDQMQYARQLGMMPPDGSAGDRAVKTAFNAKTKLSQRLKR
ncbi:MAG TPA: ester cyclase [Solirubrobacteraceae bacterium]